MTKRDDEMKPAKLIAGITDENRHPEIEWRAPVGNEVLRSNPRGREAKKTGQGFVIVGAKPRRD